MHSDCKTKTKNNRKNIWKQCILERNQTWYYLNTINFIKSSAQFVLFGEESKNFFCILTNSLVNTLEKYIVNVHFLLFSPGYANLLPPLGLGTLCQTDLCMAASSSFCLSSKYPPPQRVLSWISKLADHPKQSRGFPITSHHSDFFSS